VDSPAVRFGGALGVIAAIAMIPRAVIGTWGPPAAGQTAREYFADDSILLSATGFVPVVHILFGLGFLGVLVAMLQRVAGPGAPVYTAFAGGVLFFTLTTVGFAAEVAYPAAVVRFGDVMSTEFSEPLVALATWMYHFCQIGAAAMIFATSLVIWRTGVLPKWTAAGAVLGLPALVGTLMPTPAALASVVWMLAIGAVMVIAPPALGREGGGPIGVAATGGGTERMFPKG